MSSSDKIKLMTVRATSFEKVASTENDHGYAVEDAEVSLDGIKGSWLKNEVSKSEMADLSTAKFVVSGGRGLKNGENFALLNDFANALDGGNCAVGASRAAVDAGFVPNDMQVG